MVDASKYFHFQIRFCEFDDEQYSNEKKINITKNYLLREREWPHKAILYHVRRQKTGLPLPSGTS